MRSRPTKFGEAPFYIFSLFFDTIAPSQLKGEEEMRTSQPRWRNIGVTGFTKYEDILKVWVNFCGYMARHTKQAEPIEPRLMVGILVSDTTMQGSLNPVMSSLYPTREALPHVFPEAPPDPIKHMVHYNTATPEKLAEEAEAIIHLLRSDFDGFQFNVCWPNPSHLHTLKQRHPDKHVLLQIGSAALREYQYIREGSSYGYSIDGFMGRIREYAGCIDEVLIDPSGGKGQEIQAGQLVSLVQELAKLPELGVNVAGGLSAETIGLVQPFLDACPHVGIDAQGKLVDETTGQVSLHKVNAYFEATFQLFYPKPIDRRVNDMRELDMLVGRYPGGRNDDGMSGGIPRG